MDSLLVIDLMSGGDITHSYRKGTYLMGANGRIKGGNHSNVGLK